MTRKYFGTDGVRGKVGEYPITPDFVMKLGWAAGKVLSKKGTKKVLIGKDTFDERIWEIIESKKDIADTITGSDDSDIQRQVIDKVKESLFNPKNK